MMKYEIITGRELIEIERKRLLDIPKGIDFKNWLGNRTYPLDWMKEQFGETLIEKDGTIHPGGDRFYQHDCNVCEKETSFDEKIISLDLDMGEHKHKVNICKKCLNKLSKELRNTKQRGNDK